MKQPFLIKPPADEPWDKRLNEVLDYKYALEESSIVSITDEMGIITEVNNNFCVISKFGREELIGQDHRIISSGHHSKGFISNLWVTIAKGHIWRGDLKNRAKDGTYYWVDTTIVPFLNEDGRPYQYAAIRMDITERVKRSEELVIAERELLFQNEEKERRAAELVIANAELLFQNREKEDRASELAVANRELAFQNEEKEKRAAELVIANEELLFQNDEKEKRAAELVIANRELAFQNEEKEKRAAELVVANQELEWECPTNCVSSFCYF